MSEQEIDRVDFDQLTPPYIYSTAAVVLALGITYWIIARRSG